MAIVINFIANTGQYVRGVQDAINQTELFSRRSVDQFRTAANAVGKWAGAVSAALAGAGLALAKNNSESALQIKVLAHAANESVEDFQNYAYAVKNVGMEQDALSSILKDVNDKIGDFNQASAGGMVDFFENIAPKIGVTRKHFEGLSGKDALQLYVSTLEKANVSQADMVFYMEAIAGDATDLLPLFRENGKLLNEFTQEAIELGYATSAVDIERFIQMGDRLDTITTKVELATTEIAIGLIPIIEKIANKILDSSKEMGGFEKRTVAALNTAASAIGPFLDGWHAIKIAIYGIGTATRFMYTGFKSLFTWLIDVSAYWADEFIKKINLIIKHVNSLNPFGQIKMVDTVSDSGFMKGLRESQAESEQIFESMKVDLQSLLMQALPSDQLKAFVADAYEQADIIRSEMASAMGGAGVPKGKAPDDNKFESDRAAQRLQLLREVLQEEEEILAVNYASKIEQLALAENQKIITEDEFRELHKAHEQQFMDDLYNIRKNGYDGMNSLIKEHYGFAASETVGAFRSILDTASTGSKKLFKVNQMLAISDALISTYQGIAAGVKLGFPMGVPAVAWAAANGFAQVNKIRSMSYGGGGGGGSGGGGSSGAGAATAEPPPNTFSVNVNGMNPNQMFSGGQFGDIIGLINDRLRAGDRLVGINA